MSYDSLFDANRGLIEAYKNLGKSTSYMPSSVKHTVVNDPRVIAHSFNPKHKETVHEHLIESGYKQSGASSVGGGSSETRYVHPDTKKVVYLGSNKHSAWLDIQK